MKRWVFPLALCLLLCSCGSPGQTPGESEPAPAESGGIAVRTDWSKLGQRAEPPEPIGSRWYADYTGELIPRKDYGPLLPYVGLRLMDDWPAANGCLYGLMTQDGVVVTDPVYSAVYRPSGYDGADFYSLPVLLLEQGDEHADPESGNPLACAAAALDGSWCTPFDYCGAASGKQGLLLFQPDSVTVMSADGEVQRVWTVEEMGISQNEFDSMLSNIAWGEGWSGSWLGGYMALDWVPESEGDVRCFDLATGEIRVFSDDELLAMSGYPDWQEETLAVPNAQRLTDSILGPDAPGLLALFDYSEEETVITYYREDGTPLPELTRRGGLWYQQTAVAGGLIEILDLNTASYYDLETLEPVFRTYLNYEQD